MRLLIAVTVTDHYTDPDRRAPYTCHVPLRLTLTTVLNPQRHRILSSITARQPAR